MKRLASAAALATLFALAGSAAQAKEAPTLVGIVGNKIVAQQLVRFDPSTLRALPGGLPLAAHKYGWSFSPDRTRLALGTSLRACTRTGTTLRIVDVGRLQTLGDLRIASSGAVQASAWLAPDLIVAVVGAGRCGSATQTRVIAVDARNGRVVARTWLRGTLIRTARAPGKLVLLLAPRGKIGSASVAVVDAAGTVRTKTLGAVGAGEQSASGPAGGRVVTPGLAVDPSGRAFVLSDWDSVTEVDLKTLRVNSHMLAVRRLAKGNTGSSERTAVWLGNGLLAVTGSDSSNRNVGGHREIANTPAGLRIVSTRDWKFRALDPQVSTVELAGGILFAHGASYSYDGTKSTSTYTGLIAYSLGGRELYRAHAGLPVGQTAAIGGRGYATVGGCCRTSRTISFDLITGKPGGEAATPLWTFLLEHPG
jgi:hypothetical protein